MTNLSDVVKLLQTYKGGAGSGNFGHSGRPGKRGGSSGGSQTRPHISSLTDNDIAKLPSNERKAYAKSNAKIITDQLDKNGLEQYPHVKGNTYNEKARNMIKDSAKRATEFGREELGKLYLESLDFIND